MTAITTTSATSSLWQDLAVQRAQPRSGGDLLPLLAGADVTTSGTGVKTVSSWTPAPDAAPDRERPGPCEHPMSSLSVAYDSTQRSNAGLPWERPSATRRRVR